MKVKYSVKLSCTQKSLTNQVCVYVCEVIKFASIRRKLENLRKYALEDMIILMYNIIEFLF